MDQFSLVLGAGQRHSYDRWDGLTVDLDPQTGRITRRYTDGAFVCAMAQKQFIEYIRSRGAPIVANTHAAVEEVQSAPVPRFGEMEGSFNPLEMRDGEEPPFRLTMATGHLGSPVGLGYRPGRLGPEGHRNYAHVIMKAVVTYLHAGLLYYHFETEIPEIGEGSGDYGPINHMFPFTPVGLHQGWLEGKERTITCVSGTYAWRNKEKPVVHLFGLDGREKAHDCAVTRSGKGWSVKVGLRDWVEIAVIER
jgi:hypothetical protein